MTHDAVTPSRRPSSLAPQLPTPTLDSSVVRRQIIRQNLHFHVHHVCFSRLPDLPDVTVSDLLGVSWFVPQDSGGGRENTVAHFFSCSTGPQVHNI